MLHEVCFIEIIKDLNNKERDITSTTANTSG